MALLRVWAPIHLNLPIHTLHSFHINLQAATSNARLIHWAHALGSWFTDIVYWDGGSISSVIKRQRPVANKERAPIPCAFPSAAWGNLSGKTFQVQGAVSGHSFFMLQLVDGWACEVQFAWLTTDPGQLTKCYWWTGRSAQKWRNVRNYICLGVFGDFSFIIFFQHVYGFEYFTPTRHFWPCDKLVLFFLITFQQFFPCVGWSKIVCYVSVNFRRLKCDCDYGRGAATDIRSLCEELPHSFPTDRQRAMNQRD